MNADLAGHVSEADRLAEPGVQQLLRPPEPARRRPAHARCQASERHEHVDHQALGRERAKIVCRGQLTGQLGRARGHGGVLPVGLLVEQARERPKELIVRRVGLHHHDVRAGRAHSIGVARASRLGEHGGGDAVPGHPLEVEIEAPIDHDRDRPSLVGVPGQHGAGWEVGLDDGRGTELQAARRSAAESDGNMAGRSGHLTSGVGTPSVSLMDAPRQAASTLTAQLLFYGRAPGARRQRPPGLPWPLVSHTRGGWYVW